MIASLALLTERSGRYGARRDRLQTLGPDAVSVSYGDNGLAAAAAILTKIKPVAPEGLEIAYRFIFWSQLLEIMEYLIWVSRWSP
jgi:hypothetical protein